MQPRDSYSVTWQNPLRQWVVFVRPRDGGGRNMETICSACSTLNYGCVVGNSHGFVAATRSDCSASSKASQRVRPSSITNTMRHKYNIFMRHWVRLSACEAAAPKIALVIDELHHSFTKLSAGAADFHASQGARWRMRSCSENNSVGCQLLDRFCIALSGLNISRPQNPGLTLWALLPRRFRAV